MVHSAIVPVDSNAFVEQAWANGNGRTTELAVDTAHDPWHWRISLAQIDGDTGFSTLPGIHREFVALDAAIELQFPRASGPRQLDRLQTLRFDGNDAPSCRIHGVPTRAINLMLRGDTSGTLLARPLAGGMVLPSHTFVRWFVYMLSGHSELATGGETLPMATASAAWVMPQPGPRTRIDGAGEVVLVQLHSDSQPEQRS